MVGGYFLPSNLFSKGGDPRNLPSCRTLTSFSKREASSLRPDGRRPGFAILMVGAPALLFRNLPSCRTLPSSGERHPVSIPMVGASVFAIPMFAATGFAISMVGVWQTRSLAVQCPGACRLDTSPLRRPLSWRSPSGKPAAPAPGVPEPAVSIPRRPSAHSR